MAEEAIIVEANEPCVLPDGRVRLSCEVRIDRDEQCTAWIHIPADAVPTTDDWLAPVMVVRAMELARPVRIVGRVSAKLLAGAAQVQRVFAGFSGHFQGRPVTADEVLPTSAAPPARVGALFSGGIDSWYTALTNTTTIDDLIYIVGIDLRFDDHARRARIEPVVRRAAAELGKPLVVVETNCREFYRPWRNWDEHFLGSGLAWCCLSLGGRYTRCMFGAAHNEHCQHLFCGTSAVLDPLWSSASMQIVHDGVNSRVEKCRVVATSDTAMRGLRVCVRKDLGEFNCGRCEKCVRTMVGLHLVGALERCTTFLAPLEFEAVARVRHHGWSTRPLMQENLDAAVALGADSRLIAALRASLASAPIVEHPPAAPAPVEIKAVRSLRSKVSREVRRLLRKAGAMFGRRGPGSGVK